MRHWLFCVCFLCSTEKILVPWICTQTLEVGEMQMYSSIHIWSNMRDCFVEPHSRRRRRRAHRVNFSLLKICCILPQSVRGSRTGTFNDRVWMQWLTLAQNKEGGATTIVRSDPCRTTKYTAEGSADFATSAIWSFSIAAIDSPVNICGHACSFTS